MSTQAATFYTYVYVCGDGRRTKIDVTSPQTLIQSILEEFCRIHNLDSMKYTLKLRSVLNREHSSFLSTFQHFASHLRRRNNKPLDLSLPWRLSSIPGRAELEIVAETKQRKSIAHIALQLSDSERVVNDFSINATLWAVLLKAERNNTDLNITARFDEQERYLQPVITTPSGSFKTLKDLNTSKLQNLGIRGGQSVVLRLHHEPQQEFLRSDPNFISLLDAMRQQHPEEQEELLEKARLQSPSTASSVSTEGTGVASRAPLEDTSSISSEMRSRSNSVFEDTSMPTSETPTRQDSPQDVEMTDETTVVEPSPMSSVSEVPVAAVAESAQPDPTQPTEAIVDDGDKTIRDVKIYRIDVNSPSAYKFRSSDLDADISETDFELTPAELKMLMKETEAKRKNQEMFVSREVREREKARSHAIFNKCLVRFRFANGFIIQATFKPSHTMGELRQFVRDFLATGTELGLPSEVEQQYMIYVSPPIKRLDSADMLDKTLKDLNFLPAVILNVGLDRQFYDAQRIAAAKKGEQLQVPQQLVLKQSTIEHAQQIEGLEQLSASSQQAPESAGESASAETAAQSSAASSSTAFQGQGRTLGSAAPGEKKVPKWLKLGPGK